MKPLLLIDASLDTPYIALVRDGAPVSIEKSIPETPFSAQWPGMLRNCLERERVDMDGVTGIIFNAGPGSFTGIRIALSALKGLCFGRELRAAEVGSLHLLARPFFGKGRAVCAVMDAYMGQVYTALYSASGRELSAPRAVTPAEMALDLKGPVLCAGSDAPAFKEFLPADAMFVTPSLDEIIVAAASDGFEKFRVGDTQPVCDIVPLYLRKSYAEIRKEAL